MFLDVNDLKVSFHSRDGVNEAVKGISFQLDEGKTLAIVGESGSGKSVTSMALTKLLPPEPLCRVSGKATLDGKSLFDLSAKEMRSVRGKEIAYIFQEPGTSLNPYYTVGNQIAEAIKYHRTDVTDVWSEVVSLLDQVGIRDPEKRAKDYPHQMSGGMKQRVMIAIALACRPRILVADEPTTALDVTIEAQIIDLLKDLRTKLNMSIILITHNFGIVDEFADDIAVMFRGEIVETGPAESILANPQHSYTKALIKCIPKMGANLKRLPVVDYASLEG
ncbi:MAG: ABC transporter ATP-binding protein [Opitutales bacterium]|jgi:ABC-type dipeptide/oligopeptide/nickel transport system ATPase component|nr:ABC transporter ATP-binding protein [Opitutales bacterium]MBT5167726.1 ABC transporter ATP-binding protein [Opitutales bacterium]MBT5814985.1 ABC transporter ATP-binding protein [Opitutales bacterium]MBT6380584.1 ABC transporter ATP-binding protein [Opitutales bacterium]MBT6768089.1 ABC transporter ATP-binding protein [Opitutales bacterium]